MTKSTIDSQRKSALEAIASAVSLQLEKQTRVNLVFVCTHNSRRSQAAEWWARQYALQYGILGVTCHSAGTEVTDFHINMIAALNRVKPFLQRTLDASNPSVLDTSAEPLVHMYSKDIDSLDYLENVIAVMVCTSADANCPTIPNAIARLALPFQDPKRSDGSKDVVKVYDDSVAEIGMALDYLFQTIAKNL